MKRLIATLCLLMIGGAAFGQTGEITVKGTIKGAKDKYVVFQYRVQDDYISDTVAMKKGRFSRSIANADGLVRMTILPQSAVKTYISIPLHKYIHSRAINLHLIPGENVEVNAVDNGKYITYEVVGSETNAELARNEAVIRERYTYPYDKLYMDAEAKTQRYEIFSHRELQQQTGELKSRERAYMLDYIKANPESEVSGYYYAMIFGPHIEQMYGSLGEPARNGRYKPMVDLYRKILADERAAKSMEKAPDFTLQNDNGEDVSLSGIKKEYVVLDFWGSWCIACRLGFPAMEKAYGLYKDKIEFVGIACRDKEKNWRSALAAHSMDWIQLKDTDDNKVSDLYHVIAYPTKLIVRTSDMAILYRGEGESQAFYDKLAELSGITKYWLSCPVSQGNKAVD